jgi:hypothetical protein
MHYTWIMPVAGQCGPAIFPDYIQSDASVFKNCYLVLFILGQPCVLLPAHQKKLAAHALAFGSHHDAGTLHPAFVAFWASWFEGKELPLWSTRLLIEALEVVNSKDWKLLMELGTRSPCPSPDQGANVVR